MAAVGEGREGCDEVYQLGAPKTEDGRTSKHYEKRRKRYGGTKTTDSGRKKIYWERGTASGPVAYVSGCARSMLRRVAAGDVRHVQAAR